MRLLVVAAGLASVLSAGTAHADPTVRFGLTFGVDRNMPEAHEYGPLIAIGAHSGRFAAEAHYTYLSFMDPDTTIHRAGVALRSDLWRRNRPRIGAPGYIHSRAVFGELGAAKRFGSWRATELAPSETTSQDEVSAALGLELSDNRGAWLGALRFSMARRDPQLGAVCRGMCMSLPGDDGGLAESVMFEFTFLLNR